MGFTAATIHLYCANRTETSVQPDSKLGSTVRDALKATSSGGGTPFPCITSVCSEAHGDAMVPSSPASKCLGGQAADILWQLQGSNQPGPQALFHQLHRVCSAGRQAALMQLLDLKPLLHRSAALNSFNGTCFMRGLALRLWGTPTTSSNSTSSATTNTSNSRDSGSSSTTSSPPSMVSRGHLHLPSSGGSSSTMGWNAAIPVQLWDHLLQSRRYHCLKIHAVQIASLLEAPAEHLAALGSSVKRLVVMGCSDSRQDLPQLLAQLLAQLPLLDHLGLQGEPEACRPFLGWPVQQLQQDGSSSKTSSDLQASPAASSSTAAPGAINSSCACGRGGASSAMHARRVSWGFGVSISRPGCIPCTCNHQSSAASPPITSSNSSSSQSLGGGNPSSGSEGVSGNSGVPGPLPSTLTSICFDRVHTVGLPALLQASGCCLRRVRLLRSPEDDFRWLGSHPQLQLLQLERTGESSCSTLTGEVVVSSPGSGRWDSAVVRVRQLTLLKGLSLRNCALRELLPPTRLQLLQYVDLSGNRLQALQQGFGELPHLKALDLSHNQFDSAPDLTNASLVWLNLSHNWLRDLSGLRGVPQLQYLDVSHNESMDLSQLNHMAELRWLDATCPAPW